MLRSLLTRLGFVLLTIGVLAGCSAAAESTPSPTVAFTECRITAETAAVSLPARCTTLAVPEAYADPAGATITLSVAVVPALGNAVRPDPLLLIAGGPGQAAQQAFAPIIPLLRDLRQNRDIVLVDQRGTGNSTPFPCALTDSSDADLAAWVANCLEQMPHDPAQFTTEAMVQDLEQVRVALGYPQWNLIGVSYGTRVAQHYARRFPAQTRSLVLDGVVRPDMPIGAEIPRDGQRALDLLFTRCANDPDCAAAFPNLRSDFTALLDQLATPVTISLADPLTGQPVEVELTRDLAASTIFNLSYAVESSALIPLLIQAAVQGDLRPLAAQSQMVTAQALNMINLGLRLSVICAEDAPFFPATLPAAEASYLGVTLADQFIAPCSDWPQQPAPADLRTPLQSDIPALLLSGSADPVTPPENGDIVAATLPNSLHIVVEHQAHNIFYRGCLLRQIAAFVEAASVSAVDPACVAQIQPTAFFSSVNGPAQEVLR
jgi:pimeloyl-ACP methyl ester carboxylesterase